MKYLHLFIISLIGISTNFCVENRNELKISYERFAFTQLNPNDFSWKFLEEYAETGTITFNSIDKLIGLDSPKIGKDYFKINKIQKGENGFIAFANKTNIIIFAIDYNRISIGNEGKDIFMMFIFKDEDKEKINNELLKML